MPVALKNRSRKRPGVGAERPHSQIAAKAAGGVRQGAAAAGGGGGGDGAAGEKIRCRKHRRRPRALLEMHSPHADKGLGGGAPPRYGWFKDRFDRWTDCKVVDGKTDWETGVGRSKCRQMNRYPYEKTD